MNFVPELPLLLAYLTGVFVISITPGPDMTFFLGRTVARGIPSGLAALLGASTGVLVHSTLVAFGLSALIIASPAAFLALKVVGALYLLWLAFDAIKNGSTMRFERPNKKTKSLSAIWLQGVAINLMNPKVILFFMTFLPQFVTIGDPHAQGKLLFLGTLFAAFSALVMLPIILAAAQFTDWLKANPMATRVIDYLFGGIFGAFAIRILLTERG